MDGDEEEDAEGDDDYEERESLFGGLKSKRIKRLLDPLV